MSSKILNLIIFSAAIILMLFSPDILDESEAAWCQEPNPTCSAGPDDFCGCQSRLWIYSCDSYCNSTMVTTYNVQCGSDCKYTKYDPSTTCRIKVVDYDQWGDPLYDCVYSTTNLHSGTCCVNVKDGDDAGGIVEPPSDTCGEICWTCTDNGTYPNGNPYCVPGSETDVLTCGGGASCTGTYASGSTLLRSCHGGNCDNDPCVNDCSCTDYSCPATTITENTGPLCYVENASCSCTTECMNTKINRNATQCFRPETNLLTPKPPAYTGMIVAGFNRTTEYGTMLIPRPLANESVQVYLPTYTADSTGARAIKYSICWNNIGSAEWSDPSTTPWRSASNTYGEDFCSPIDFTANNPGLSNIYDFTPSIAGGAQTVLDYGYKGGSLNEYAFINECDNTAKLSHDISWTGGAYEVNTLPTFKSIANVTEFETYMACRNDSYSSSRINDILSYDVTVTDVNGASNIETIAVWWGRNEAGLPDIKNLAVDATTPRTEHVGQFGFMVEKGRNSSNWRWVFVPRSQPSVSDNEMIWWRSDDYLISNSFLPDEHNPIIIYGYDGKATAYVRNITVIENGNDATLSFDIEFLHEINARDYGLSDNIYKIPDGEYYISVAVGDEFQYMAGTWPTSGTNRVTPAWKYNVAQWNIDFSPPDIAYKDQVVTSSQRFDISWFATDLESIYNGVQSGLKVAVGDASYYDTDNPIFNTDPYPAGGEYRYSPDRYNIGSTNQAVLSSHLWWKTSGFGTFTDPVTQSIDIGEVEDGQLDFYNAAMDYACNYTRCGVPTADRFGDNNDIDDINNNGVTAEGYYSSANCDSLVINEPWIATRGGLVYSDNGVNILNNDLGVSEFLTPLTSQNELGSSINGSFWADPYRMHISTIPEVTDVRFANFLIIDSGSFNSKYSNHITSSYRDLGGESNNQPSYSSFVDRYQRMLERSDAEKYDQITYTSGALLRGSLRLGENDPAVLVDARNGELSNKICSTTINSKPVCYDTCGCAEVITDIGNGQFSGTCDCERGSSSTVTCTLEQSCSDALSCSEELSCYSPGECREVDEWCDMGCTGDFCVIRPRDFQEDSSLEIASDFICDIPAVIFVSGDLLINPNVFKGPGILDGCIFIVRGDVEITGGEKQDEPSVCSSSGVTDLGCYPGYDLIESYIISDGLIIIDEDFADDNPSPYNLVNDGLSLRGGLIALEQDASFASIELERSLRLEFNARYPTLVIHADPRYQQIARYILGADKDSYVTDIGYKPF